MADAPTPTAPPPPPAAASKAPDQSKLQQLLGLAKERLQAQQRALSARDATIDALRADLKKTATFGAATRPAAEGAVVAALSVVLEKDVGLEGDGRWVLFEFEETDRPAWRRFDDEPALQDFVRRDPGSEPVDVPEPALTRAAAAEVRNAAKADVEAATARSREASARAAVERTRLDGLLRDARSSRVRDDDAELAERRKALLAATAPADASDAATAELKKRCDELAGEVARLRQVGPDAAIASRWRQRYETAVAERDTAREEARLLRAGAAGGDSTMTAAADLSTKYDALRREYKLYRANALRALDEARKKPNGGGTSGKPALADLGRRAAAPRPAGAPAEGDKIAYLKNLMAKSLAA